MNAWTSKQMQEEYQYRIQERLGILAPLREPTEEEREIAESEADAWMQMMVNAQKTYQQSSLL
jgi:vacuolar-type H+-ATPase subunit I/STV1